MKTNHIQTIPAMSVYALYANITENYFDYTPPPQYFARLTYKKSGVKNTRSRRFLGNRLIQQESVQKRLKLSANRSNPYIYRY